MCCPCIILKLTLFFYSNVVTHHVIILKLKRMIMCYPRIILKKSIPIFIIYSFPKKKKKKKKIHYLCQDITRYNDTIF